MKRMRSRVYLTASFALSSALAFGQGAFSGETPVLAPAALILGLLLGLYLLARHADRWLIRRGFREGVLEPRRAAMLGLVGRRAPAYVGNDPFFHFRRGFTVSLKGAPEPQLDESVQANTFALQPANFIGMVPIPKVMVEVGDRVKAGDPVFFDKSAPDVLYCAPVSGEVIELNRGAKRSIRELVILADKEMQYRAYQLPDLEQAGREELVEFLLGSGAWPLIRQRPYNIVPKKEDIPRDIFITTFDTAPLSPDLNFVVEGRGEAFQRGLDVLNKLTPGKVYLGMDGRGKAAPSEVFTEARGVERAWFSGKHPAGNVGVQIHHLKPLANGDTVWTLGVQEVITLGTLFLEGRFDTTRIVALGGAEVKAPRYLRTRQGARISDLTEHALQDAQKKVRYISGDVLSGEKKARESFLNFYDDQITVIEEGDYFEMFGWLLPIKPRPSASLTFPNFLFPKKAFRGDTNTHGEKRAFVVTGQYEQVLPMDIYPQHLMKAILVNDFEQMEGLGLHELVEEDVALCEFVCTSKQPLQQILRRGLDQLREQG